MYVCMCNVIWFWLLLLLLYATFDLFIYVDQQCVYLPFLIKQSEEISIEHRFHDCFTLPVYIISVHDCKANSSTISQG